MKKIYKYAVVNMLVILFLFFLFDSFFYLKEKFVLDKEQAKDVYLVDAYRVLPIRKFKKVYDSYLKEYKNVKFQGFFRNDSIKENEKKKPVLLLGCSFTFGQGLKDEETFSYKLSELSDRTVYNMGLSGGGISHAVYMMKNGFHSKVKNPEYIIYTFIEYHIHRLYMETSFFHDLCYFYKYDKTGNLIPKTETDYWYWHSYMLRTLYGKFYSNGYISKKNDKIQFLLKHFLLLKFEIQKRYPDSKFVIFAYDGENGFDDERYLKSIEKELKENGIEIVYLNEISKIDYQKPPYILEDGHPSKEAWNSIVPLLIKKLSL